MPIVFALLFLASPIAAAMALETEQFVLFLGLFVLIGIVSADRLASALPRDETVKGQAIERDGKTSTVDAGRAFKHTRRQSAA